MPTIVRGTALRPCVSKNRRQYTPELVKKVHDRLAAHLASETAAPITMLSHHGAGDDSLRIAGRLRNVSMDPTGAMHYEAVLADTDAGKTIAALATPGPDGKQFISGVSIRGRWLGDTRETAEGYETGDDLEVLGLDFTSSPGVPGANVTATTEAAAASYAATVEGDTTGLIFESAEASSLINEADDTPPEPAPVVETAPPADTDRIIREANETIESLRRVVAEHSAASHSAADHQADAVSESEGVMPDSKPAADAVTESKPVVEAVTITKADLSALLESAVKSALAEAAKPEPARTYTVEEAMEAPEFAAAVRALVAKGAAQQANESAKTTLRDLLESGDIRPTRKGIVRQLEENKSAKPLHEMSGEEFSNEIADLINGLQGAK